MWRVWIGVGFVALGVAVCVAAFSHAAGAKWFFLTPGILLVHIGFILMSNGLSYHGAKMCDLCLPFSKGMPINNRVELQDLHNRLFFDGVKTGVLQVVDGSLQWDDFIDCTLECAACHERFCLMCDVYHGSGGEYGPID
ncbi:MAG: hypothetical protein ACJ8C4_08495 [Gemmataceae bacterium]